MRTLRPTRNLLVEVWPHVACSPTGPVMRPRVKIRRNLALEGEITIWPEEMDALLAALLEAAAALERKQPSR
jgi:hypothetical protein